MKNIIKVFMEAYNNDGKNIYEGAGVHRCKEFYVEEAFKALKKAGYKITKTSGD